MRELGAALALLGVIGVVAVAVIVGRLAGEIPAGGETIFGVEGERFAASGSLIDDKDLLKTAADYWKDNDDYDGGLDDSIRALWAGEIGSGRTVILQRADEFAAVSFGNGGEPTLSAATLRGNRFIVFDEGILLPTGAPDRWTEVVDTDTTVETEPQQAFDRMLVLETRSAIALVPDKPGVVMAGLDQDFGVGSVEAEDWETFRDAITEPRYARTTAAAAGEALRGGPGAGVSETFYEDTGIELADPEATVFSRALRILHKDEDGVAAAAWDGKGTAIGFAEGDPPESQLLGRHEAGGPGLAAGPLGSGVVVAGDKEITQIEVAGQPPVKGNFAIISGTGDDMPVVRGRLADGKEIYAAGGGYDVPDLDEK